MKRKIAGNANVGHSLQVSWIRPITCRSGCPKRPRSKDPEKRKRVSKVDRDKSSLVGIPNCVALALNFKNLVVEYVVKRADDNIHAAPTNCTLEEMAAKVGMIEVRDASCMCADAAVTADSKRGIDVIMESLFAKKMGLFLIRRWMRFLNVSQ